MCTKVTNSYIIYTRDRKYELEQHKFLNFCWTGGLDTPCDICNQPFDFSIEPPVRTLQLPTGQRVDSPVDENPPGNPSSYGLQVSNSHLRCLKRRQVRYLPISHAWHSDVAVAYASRTTNPEAAERAYIMPIRILGSLAAQFGQGVRIWHDYISVPQWQDNFRGTKILPQIFDIFRYAGTALVHLDDLNVNARAERPIEGDEMSRVLKCRWFTRVWAIVEYQMCQDAYLMDSSYTILPKTIQTLANDLSRHDKAPLFILQRPNRSQICLGYAYDMILYQGCSTYRDRFIAAYSIIDFGDARHDVSMLPIDTGEACLWLHSRCLEKGDLSPLLLKPVKEEVESRMAAWLRCHAQMDGETWSWGYQENPAETEVCLDENGISLELELIGRAVNNTSATFWEDSSKLRVQCDRCDNCSEIETTLWAAIKTNATLYRIPGLRYSNLGNDEVGVVIESRRIKGRCRLGKQLHNCIPQRVKVMLA